MVPVSYTHLMEEPENIIRHLEMYFAAKEGDLVGKTVMITAGPTYEKIGRRF